ncbi:putative ArsR family transcriptional regulator [Nocardioides luteus]|uniref:Transcriptional regulator n=1 Tax=Nocardioides luteus TaxID=1844 RepID=A0ABQ5T3K6_9ACTN|nr:helix-turn-helix domain-containing protein [Nocardioides luteus]MDR7309548.1 putative ArsR family transcriptional regulator [Nocardioides luteus]GGR51995.1 transcriptional regulator [Nocardioides luteus]GLJ70669.1 transcriptional regulator [Nocardioides luteus]
MATYDDPRILRAIAHPTRNRVLHELSAAGSLRAADIAKRTGIPANQASFHLRQLAKYGLVEIAPGAGRDKRDRVWRLVDDDITINPREIVEQPGGAAAFTVFQRNSVAWGHHLVDEAYRISDDDDEDRAKRIVSETSLRLTKPEAEQLQRDLGEVVARYRAVGRASSGDEGRELYSVYQLIQPMPELAGEQESVEG